MVQGGVTLMVCVGVTEGGVTPTRCLLRHQSANTVPMMTNTPTPTPVAMPMMVPLLSRAGLLLLGAVAGPVMGDGEGCADGEGARWEGDGLL